MYLYQKTKLDAILEYQSRVQISKVMNKYQIKESTTLYEWIRKMG